MKILTLMTFVAILGFAFYWFLYRPEEIKKQCYKIAIQGSFDKDYKSCLLSYGLPSFLEK